MPQFERQIKLPKRLENRVETEGHIYVGRAYGLHFDDSGISGTASLSRYSNSRKIFGVQLFPDFRVKTTRYKYSTEFFILNGRTSPIIGGYRSAIITNLANRGIFVAGELLDNVFGPIDRELMDFYRQVFPETDEISKRQTSNNEGMIINVRHEESWRGPVSLYTIEDSDGTYHHVGLLGTERHLRCGDKVRVEYEKNMWLNIHSEMEELRLEISPNQVQFITPEQIWHKMTGYQKL